MRLRSLKIYCDIVDRHSFSRAAEANGISQSKASQVVHQLEERLGVKLIDRSKRPFVLTPEGQRFHEGCRVIVQRYEDLEREVRSLHEAVAARLTVASIYSVGLAHMSGYLREFLAAHPQGRRAAGIPASAPRLRGGRQRSGRPRAGQLSGGIARVWRRSPGARSRWLLVCHPRTSAGRGWPAYGSKRWRASRWWRFKRAWRFAPRDRSSARQHDVEVRSGTGVRQYRDDQAGHRDRRRRRACCRCRPSNAKLPAARWPPYPLAGTALVRPLGIIHRRDRKLSEMACTIRRVCCKLMPAMPAIRRPTAESSIMPRGNLWRPLARASPRRST